MSALVALAIYACVINSGPCDTFIWLDVPEIRILTGLSESTRKTRRANLKVQRHRLNPVNATDMPRVLNAPAADPPIYPDYCHILSPTIGKWCPVRTIDVHALDDVGMFCDGHRLLHWGNHPVKWVRLTGIIVAVAERGNGTRAMRVYTLDDSSGACIDCPASTSHGNSGARSKDIGSGGDKAMPSVLTPSVPWDLVVVGSVVKVKGRIGFWWEQRQVEVVKIEILGCTDTEVRCWNEVRDFRRNILSQPWHLSHEEKRLCRKLMERQKRRARKAQRRVVEC